MSTVKATNFSHPSASDVGITLGADGSVVLPQGFTGGIGSNVVITEASDFSTTSTSSVDVTGATATITLSAATSKVLLIATGGHIYTESGSFFTVELWDASNLLKASELRISIAAFNKVPVSFATIVTPGSVGPHTFRLRAKMSSSTGYWVDPTIIAIEVAA